MRTPLHSRRLAAVAIAATALLGLTACTGSPSGTDSSNPSSSAPADSGSGTGSGDGQSVEDACQLVNDTITSATEEFENLATDDPSAVVDGMQAAAQSLADASGQITNAEVAEIIPDLQAMFEQTSEVMAAIIDGDTDRVGELEEIGSGFQKTTERFQELCAPAE